MNLIFTVTPQEVKPLIEPCHEIDKVEVDFDGDLRIQITDKDQDQVNMLLTGLNKERLLLSLPFNIPEGYVIASLLAATYWNNRKDSHNTFAYVSGNGACILESHLLLKGGVTAEHIKAWVLNLVNDVNRFEEVLFSTLREQGKDSESSNSNGLGQFFGEIAHGIGEGLVRALLS